MGECSSVSPTSRSGEGTFNYMNGDKYSGNWKNGKRYGKGSFFYVNGDTKIGVWEDGRILPE